MTWWTQQYRKFVNNSSVDKYNDTQKFPVAKASPGFDVYEAEDRALLRPRVELLLEDGVPELFMFQVWIDAEGEVAIPGFWWEHLAAFN